MFLLFSHGIYKGNQPKGRMIVQKISSQHCAGFQNCGVIQIDWIINGGKQSRDHPSPGQIFHGDHRTGYLPDNEQGNEVLELLKIAWKRKLMFTVGHSITRGVDGVVIWNGIHAKTNLSGGASHHGYPDPEYFKRVKEELKAKGIE